MADSLVIRVDGNVTGYKEALNQVSNETKRLEDAAANIAKKSAVAFAGLTAAITGTVMMYREQEQAEIRTRQTIEATGGAAGVTAEEIFKMASALQEVTTFGDEAIIGGQNLLLTFKNIGQDVFPRATEIMLDMSTAMGQDLKSSAIQLGKALNDPKVGITALQRVGITFNETQKETIKSLVDQGQTARAQTIILKELESQFGGVSRAAANGTGEFIQLKNIMGDFLEDIGRELTPTLTKAIRPLKEFFLFMREYPQIAKAAAKVLLVGAAVTGVVSVVGVATVAFLKMRAALIAAGGAMRILQMGIRGVVGATGIGLLIIGLDLLVSNWSEVFKTMQSVFSNFAKNITNIGDGLGTFLKGIFSLDIDKIKSGFSQVKNAIAESAKGIVEDVKEIYTDDNGEKEILPIKQADVEKNNENMDLMQQQTLEKMQKQAEEKRQKQLEQDEIDLGIKRDKEEADLERQIEVDALKNDQELQRLNQEIENEDDRVKKLSLIKRREELIESKRNQRRIKEAQGNAKVLMMIDQVKNNAIYQGTSQAFGNLEQLTQSKNKTLKNIGKVAARANIIIRTAEAAMNIYRGFSAIPIVGPVLGAAGAAAAIAFGAEQLQKVNNARKGFVIRGGIPGVDSVPVMAQQNEIISPAENFEEVIGSVRAKREAENLGGTFGSATEILIGFDGAEASQVLSIRQVEDRELGITRNALNVA